MMRKLITATLILGTLCLPACNRKQIWTSTPASQAVSARSYKVGLEPLKKNAPFFNWFRLTVTNTSDRDMEIDWNRTRYFHNGRDAGGVFFEGIEPDAIKNATVPGALIRPGETFTRDIAPVKLVAFAPLREQSIDTKNRNISAGMIPPGENGLLLVIRQDAKLARAQILVRIENRDAE